MSLLVVKKIIGSLGVVTICFILIVQFFKDNTKNTIVLAKTAQNHSTGKHAGLTPQFSSTPTIISTPTPYISTTTSISQYSISPTVGQTPTVLPSSAIIPTSTPIQNQTQKQTWDIQSIDAMKDTKDAVCNQRSDEWINSWLDKAVELGANYVAISTPYDNPSCGNAINYTKQWVKDIRAHGLKVWHRHMPLSFEGIYNVQKASDQNKFLTLISNYIKNNPDIFADGDIFTPIPEPQNGGIQGVTYCANSLCQFSNQSDFNSWLRLAMTTAKDTFSSIGKSNIKIGYFGFDGFVAWGDNNPDWHGILEDQTIQMMGNITVDHYPQLVNDTMDNDLTELQTRYPNIPIVIGEWGTVDGKNVVQEVLEYMGAAKKHGVVGFNYWQFGPEGSGEQLINDDFSNRSQFSAVQSFYKPQ